MSKSRKSPRDKPESAKAQNGKSASGQKTNGKKESKQKTVAAEIGGVGVREEAASPAPSPAPRPSAQAAAKPAQPPPKPVAANPAPSAARPAQPAAKPAPKPEPKPAAPVARPAPAASEKASVAREASVASKPAAETPKAPQPLPESAADTIERSFRAAGQGTVAVNCKLLDFARANVNSGFDHAKDLAAARSPLRIMWLQMEYWHDCLETFASQAQELRALSVELVANANEPIRQQLRRGLKSTAA
jgi:hypothetical protein